jgi:hypothetical protein
VQVPPLPSIPEELRGGQFVLVELAWLGDEAAVAPYLAPLRALGPMVDTCAAIPAARLQELHMDPPEPVPGLGDGFMLDELPGEAIDALLAVAGAGSGSPLVSLELRHLGGELGRARPEHGALPALDASFALFAVGIPMDAGMAAALTAHFPRVREAMTPWDSGRHYLNFAEQETDTRTAYGAAAYERLREVKLAYDAADTFRANHRIPLSA